MRHISLQMYFELACKNYENSGSSNGRVDFEDDCVGVSGFEGYTIVNFERMLKGSVWYATILKNYRSAAKKLRLICTSLLCVSIADSLLSFWTMSKSFCSYFPQKSEFWKMLWHMMQSKSNKCIAFPLFLAYYWLISSEGSETTVYTPLAKYTISLRTLTSLVRAA